MRKAKIFICYFAYKQTSRNTPNNTKNRSLLSYLVEKFNLSTVQFYYYTILQIRP